MLHMIKKYKQLTEEEREKLFNLLNRDVSYRKIAKVLNRDVSTISREIRRNHHKRLEFYLPDTANRKAIRRKMGNRKRRYLEKAPKILEYVIEKLMVGWTPQLIAGRMKLELGTTVNQESIYQYIYSLEGRKRNLRQYLPRGHRIRHRKSGRRTHRGKIPNRIDISLRPRAATRRMVFGHWEGDSVLYKGHKQSLATEVERKSRFTMLRKPKNRSAYARNRVLRQIFEPLPLAARKSQTVDNGSEFSGHEWLKNKIGLPTFFATPYSSWQRGSNEWKNGLLRRYVPKDTDISKIRQPTLQRIQDAINDRPMKCLNFKTPKEVFEKEMQKLSLKSI